MNLEKPGLPPERIRLIGLFFTITIGSFFVWSLVSKSPVSVDGYTYEVVATYRHDTTSFTQGLVYSDGDLYESTGKFGLSKIRKVNLTTGIASISKDLPEEFFGEGLTRVGDELIQLTWKNEVAIVYDLDLNETRRIPFEGEGWGLAYDGVHLIFSDGQSVITFRDPKTFEVVREITVSTRGQASVSNQ